MIQQANVKQTMGFTLVEILVAFFLFVLLLGGALGGVQQAVGFQRTTLERQAAIEEVSYALEYMSRAIRGARKDMGPTCLTSQPGSGWTFEWEATPFPTPNFVRIRFLDRNDRCREFTWEQVGGQPTLQERISSDSSASNFGPKYNLISDDFSVPVFGQIVRGEYEGDIVIPDYSQPFIHFHFTVANKSMTTDFLTVQTTMSTRQIDVP